MTTHRMVRAVSALVLGLGLVALGGCGGGGQTSSSRGSIAVKGTMGGGVTLASNETVLRKALAWLLPGKAYASGTVIDNVLAADASGHFVLATKSANGFTLALPKGQLYLIAFLSGTTTVAIYQADATGAGWTALPVTSASHDVDLGTLTLTGTVGTGTTDPETVSTALGLAPGLSNVIGVWDAAMQRLANVDVDGDGTFDFQQNRSYWFGIHYEFDPGDSFSAIQAGYGDETRTTYIGYGYFFNASPAGSHDWACATLAAPSPITSPGSPSSPSNQSCSGVTSSTECFQSSFGGSGVSVNFYCGAGTALGNIATAPATPPPGTYTVTVDGTSNFTFRNVASQAIAPTLDHIYVPSVLLTTSGAKVTGLAFRWWKHDPVAGWIQPDATELSAIVGSVTYELGEAGWAGNPAVDRAGGALPVSPSGSVAVAAQSTFTPGVLRISYTDVFGYGYGFEWR